MLFPRLLLSMPVRPMFEGLESYRRRKEVGRYRSRIRETANFFNSSHLSNQIYLSIIKIFSPNTLSMTVIVFKEHATRPMNGIKIDDYHITKKCIEDSYL